MSSKIIFTLVNRCFGMLLKVKNHCLILMEQWIQHEEWKMYIYLNIYYKRIFLYSQYKETYLRFIFDAFLKIWQRKRIFKLNSKLIRYLLEFIILLIFLHCRECCEKLNSIKHGIRRISSFLEKCHFFLFGILKNKFRIHAKKK